MGEHILPANPPRAQDIGAPAHGLDVPRGRLGELYLRHGPDALRLALLLTGDGPLAQDLVQEAFLRLGGRLVHLRDPEAFPSYLRRTVVNLANSHFRRRLLERRHHARVGALRGADAAAADPETRDVLRRALLGLPERQRAAIVLRFYEDLPERQVAELLGCRPGTVSSLVSRGMSTLRDVMREE